MKIVKKQAAELKAWAKALAENTGRTETEVMEELKTELKALIAKPMLKNFNDDEKVEHAIRILKATHTVPLVQSGKSFELLILDFTLPKKITPKDTSKEPFIRADINGIAICVEDDATPKEQELNFFNLALFRDNTKLISEIECGKTYKAKVSSKFDNGIWNLNAIDNMTRFTLAKEQLEMNIEEFLTEQFPLVQIAEAEFNLSDMKRKKNDFKLVRGNVTYAGVHTSDSGYTYGRYVLIDDSLDIEDLKRNGGLSIMADPSQIRYAEGSDLLILGEITKNDERIGMSAKAVIPIIPIPRQSDDSDDDETDAEKDDDDEFVDEDEAKPKKSEDEAEDGEASDDEDKKPAEDDDSEFVDEPEMKDDDDAEPEQPKKVEKKTKKAKVAKKEEDDDDVIEL